MKSAYQILRRPVITEKGLAIKENQNTLVFQVATQATKTEIKAGRAKAFLRSRCIQCGLRRIREKNGGVGKFYRLPSGLEERRTCG
jgi:formate dehydrogenase assembly factor FdhD